MSILLRTFSSFQPTLTSLLGHCNPCSGCFEWPLVTRCEKDEWDSSPRFLVHPLLGVGSKGQSSQNCLWKKTEQVVKSLIGMLFTSYGGLRMAILATSKVSKDFRVTIPKEVRESLKLKKGDEVVFFLMGGVQGRVCFRKA